MNIQELCRHFLAFRGAASKDLKVAAEATAATINGGQRKTPTELPDALAKFVRKVATDAYKVMDEDFDTLREHYTEQEIFEFLLATTLGSANGRYEQALSLLEANHAT